jgi:hypothetical protein
MVALAAYAEEIRMRYPALSRDLMRILLDTFPEDEDDNHRDAHR